MLTTQRVNCPLTDIEKATDRPSPDHTILPLGEPTTCKLPSPPGDAESLGENTLRSPVPSGLTTRSEELRTTELSARTIRVIAR